MAHYDEEKKRYFLDEPDNQAEDTLGRFTGFLCAALFTPPQERRTEPLPNEALHGV